MSDSSKDVPVNGSDVIAALLADPDRLRRRFILAAVLGPPRSKRPQRPR
jgi:hypothetical protein